MAESPPVLDLESAAALGTVASVTEAGSAKRKVIFSYSNGGEGGELRCYSSPSSSSSSSGLDCCSSHGNGSTDILKEEASEFSDLKDESNDISASTYGGLKRREIIAESSSDPKAAAAAAAPRDWNSCSSLFNNEEAENDLVQVVGGGDENDEKDDVNSRRRPRPKKAKMPSNAELEDFFSVTENDLMRQFTHRYNFDFVKEEPLEGRYEWVPVRVVQGWFSGGRGSSGRKTREIVEEL